MTCPWYVDPDAWVFTVPMLALLLWLYSLPRNTFIKRAWREAVAQRAEGMASLFHIKMPSPPRERPAVEKTLFWVAFTLLAAVSLNSLAVFAGILHNPEIPMPAWAREAKRKYNPDDYEIIHEGQTLRAQLKARPGTQPSPTTEISH